MKIGLILRDAGGCHYRFHMESLQERYAIRRMDGFGWGAGSILVPWTRTGLTASVSHFLQAGCHLYLNFFAWNSGTHHNDGFSRETTNYHSGCAHGLGVSDRGRGVCGPFSFRTALIV
jgi:hypothetical protein